MDFNWANSVPNWPPGREQSDPNFVGNRSTSPLYGARCSVCRVPVPITLPNDSAVWYLLCLPMTRPSICHDPVNLQIALFNWEIVQMYSKRWFYCSLLFCINVCAPRQIKLQGGEGGVVQLRVEFGKISFGQCNPRRLNVNHRNYWTMLLTYDIGCSRKAKL